MWKYGCGGVVCCVGDNELSEDMSSTGDWNGKPFGDELWWSGEFWRPEDSSETNGGHSCKLGGDVCGGDTRSDCGSDVCCLDDCSGVECSDDDGESWSPLISRKMSLNMS